jgi:sugar lactone lactonase YvrE
MIKRIFTAFILVLSATTSYAQLVETLIDHPKVTDGLHCDPEGNVYTTPGGLQGGFKIGKYDPTAQDYDPNFANGFSGPIDIDQYQDSFLVVTNFDNNTLSRYNLNTQIIEILATGLEGPAGIAIDAFDNIYVTNWGIWQSSAGQTINKITPNGVSTIYIDTVLLNHPQAICINNEGVLIVHSENSLYKVNAVDSTLQHWVSMGFGVGHLTFRDKDSCVYGTNAQGNKIVRITDQGIVSVIAGSSQGSQDGDVSIALFHNPLGIAFSPTEDTIYIAEAAGSHKLRRIALNQFADLFIPIQHQLHIYPNPMTDVLIVENPDKTEIEIELVDLTGRLLLSKTSTEAEIELRVSEIPKGEYLVHIRSEVGETAEKIVKR